MNKNLLRWNRSGLRPFTYVDGNAATYLELLRSTLAESFPSAAVNGGWLAPFFDANRLAGENADDEWRQALTNEFLRQQYDSRKDDDLGWALMRAFARSCHVLARHMDVHANAAFLHTATAWEDARKMVSMLGYRPAGATSATTHLVLLARAKGVVKKGLQVEYRPPEGGPAVVFETLADVEVDPTRNEFLNDQTGGVSPTLGSPTSGQSIWRASPKAPVQNGDSVLILSGTDACAATVTNVGGELTLHPSGEATTPASGEVTPLAAKESRWLTWEAKKAVLRTSARFRRATWLNGPRVRRTGHYQGGLSPHGFSAGSIIAWRPRKKEGKEAEQWRFAEVERADTFGITLKRHSVRYREEAEPKRNADSPFNDDDVWPKEEEWLEVRRAARLVGTTVVPANAEAEKILGTLAGFTARKLIPMMSGATAVPLESSEAQTELNTVALGEKGGTRVIEDKDLLGFLRWLLGTIQLVPTIPIEPEQLLTLGVTLLAKDLRIPSTGKRVYEAFLDLLGSTGNEQYNEKSPPPAPLFRFWIAPGNDGKNKEKWEAGNTPGPIPIAETRIDSELWYLPTQEDGAGSARSAVAERPLYIHNTPPENRYYFDGAPYGLRVGDWVAVEMRDGGTADAQWRAAKVLQLDESPAETAERRAPCFAMTFGAEWAASPATLEVLQIHADYRHEGPPALPETQEEGGADVSLLPPEVGQILYTPDGQEAVVTSERKIVMVSDPSQQVLPGVRLFGHVVLAGHGVRQPTIRLGSAVGDESLLLEYRDVSTVPDSRLARGARKDIEVRVNGEQWHAVTSFDDSESTDRHFTTSTTEDGYLALEFGDGRNGRALPAGRGHVSVDFRVGAGRVSIPEGELRSLVQPHPLLTGVLHCVEVQGGSDMETRADMQSLAPASVLALERAVSVRDFEDLATQHWSVTQARAFLRVGGGTGRRDRVDVVVAGDAELDDRALGEVNDYLSRRAVPTVEVCVAKAPIVKAEPSVTFRVDPARYELPEVKRRVVVAVARAFAIGKRRIGEPIDKSELYAVVEAIEGVEDCECEPNNGNPSGPPDRCIWHVDAKETGVQEPTEYVP